ncbi:MAG: tetratricopeptide repeat protein [Bacteroidales bacterium]|nr:tetratricopeptide repeat protein [Bacteroidales bacterium]
MFSDDFLNFDEEDEFSDLISRCESAYEAGTLEDMRFTEEEFEHLINSFIDEMEDDMVYTLTRMGYNQHPYSLELIIRYADVLIVNREQDIAKEILDKQFSIDSGNSDIHFLLARVYIKKGDFTTANEYIESALSLAGDESLDMLLTAAQDFIDIGNFKCAIRLLERAESTAPDNYEIINDLAFCYERSDMLEKSLVYYEKYLDIDPFNDNVWFNVGTIHARELNMKKALEAFDYAIALNPDNSSVLYNKAILLVNGGNYDDGIETFNSFLKLEPGNNFALTGIADAYLAKDRLDDSLTFFRMVLSTDMESIDANTGVAYISMLKHNSSEALVSLRKIIGDEKTDYNFLYTELLASYKRTKNPEFLVYYLTSLYYIKENELLFIYLEILLSYDEVWLARLFELIPSLKRDDSVTKHINKVKKRTKQG